MVEHRLIVRDRAGEKILMAGDSTALALPAFDFEDRHTADTDYINQVARELYGIEVTVLRCLRHTDDGGKPVRIYELEHHDTHAPGALRWIGREDIAQQPWQLREDRAAVLEWFVEVSARQTGLADWQRPGWWQEVRQWIVDRLAAERAGRIIQLVQRRQWDSSCVIEVRCENGDYFFKAMPEVSRECAVAVFLSRMGAAVPRVVASEPRRKWMLMRAFAGSSLEDSSDLRRWLAGLEAYAEIQLQSASRTEELTQLGCPTLNMEKLADDIDALLSDSAALLEGEPDGLSASQIEFLLTQAPKLRSGCMRLSDAAVPLTIDHGDLFPGNVLVNDNGSAIIDWEDVRIANPFLSIAPLLAGMDSYQPAMNLRDSRDRFREVYVRTFAKFGEPREVREVFAIAEPLAMIEMSIRYWRQPAATVAVNPWMRTTVPYFASLPFRRLRVDTSWPA